MSIENMSPRSGDIIGEDGNVYNKVTLYQNAGASAESVGKVNKAHYSPSSGRIIGENGDVFNEVDLLKSMGGGGESATNCNALNVTYAELVALCDSGKLIPGTRYRITDYVTAAVQAEARSAGHAFDIIVTADSTNTLNEDAKAIQRAGDTYFANSDLAAWRLKYCIDNDNYKFAWADRTNGKGVIYEMVDEYNNRCGYDFKNIQFKRYALDEVTEDYIDTLDGTNVGARGSDGSYYPWGGKYKHRRLYMGIHIYEVQ